MTHTATLKRLFGLATLLPALLHELTHALVAAPWAERVTVSIDPGGSGAVCGIEWRDDAPTLGQATAMIAPTLAGTTGAAIGGVWLVEQGLPGSPTGLGLYAVAVVGWAVYTGASARDLAELRQTTEDNK